MNSLPENSKDSDTISSFKSKLKSFYFTRLLNVFDSDDFRSFKLIFQSVAVLIFSLRVLVKLISIF